MINRISIQTDSDLNWHDTPGIEEVFVSRSGDKHDVEIPVCVITGRKPGPTFTIMSGMHAGEYAGILAAHKNIKTINPDELLGRLIVIPVISKRAFYNRSMQLSPADEKEIHFVKPGNPKGTYSDVLIDTLFQIVKGSDYLIDMHSGEMVQALYPWVPVPMIGSKEIQEAPLGLAKGYKVDFLEYRYEIEAIPPLCLALFEAGIINIWVEIGKNGLPSKRDISAHHDGLVAALKTVGMLQGDPDRPKQKILTGKRHQINASESGIWYPKITEGQIVEKGELLGITTDIFGNFLEEYRARTRSFVLYYWTSPAINIERKPHGYDWHSGLVSLLELEED